MKLTSFGNFVNFPVSPVRATTLRNPAAVVGARRSVTETYRDAICSRLHNVLCATYLCGEA
jgi:hypothetical protein